MENGLSRRDFVAQTVKSVAAFSLIQGAFRTGAFAAEIEPVMKRWLLQLHELCGDVKANRIQPLVWQAHMESLYNRISLEELLHFIDFQRLSADLHLPPDRAAIRQVRFPRMAGISERAPFGRKIFALRKGAAVVPHAHNNMVSAHLVLEGSFRVRTFQRRWDLETEPGFLMLEPAKDEIYGPGRLLTMSDEMDNIHWLVAVSSRAYTLDIPVVDLITSREYLNPANRYSMIFVDPTIGVGGQSPITAPIIGFEQAIAKFGRG